MYIQSKNILLQWNEEKNTHLKETRGICFENVIEAITNNQYVMTPHPNPRYVHQLMIYFTHNNYYYACPFVLNDKEMFLKTVYPSRKAKKIIKGII